MSSDSFSRVKTHARGGPLRAATAKYRYFLFYAWVFDSTTNVIAVTWSPSPSRCAAQLVRKSFSARSRRGTAVVFVRWPLNDDVLRARGDARRPESTGSNRFRSIVASRLQPFFIHRRRMKRLILYVWRGAVSVNRPMPCVTLFVFLFNNNIFR